MRLDRMKVFGIVAILVVVGAASTFALLVPPDEEPHRAVVTYRVDDVFKHRILLPDGSSTQATLKVYPPRPFPGANGTFVLGLPQIQTIILGGEPQANAMVLDLENGGTLLYLDPCYIDPAYPCADDDVTYVTWQRCPLGGWVSALTLEDLRRPNLTLSEPATGARFEFQVIQLERDRYRVSPAAEETRPACEQPASYTIDARRGVIDTIEGGEARIELVSLDKGDGPEYRMKRLPSVASRLVEPDTARSGPLPSGGERIGPAAWTLGMAWDAAVDQSSELQAFIAREPDAFLIKAELGSSTATMGPIELSTWDWSFDVLGASRTGYTVRSTSTSMAGVSSQPEIVVQPLVVPPTVPPRYTPPAREGADITEAAVAVQGLGIGTPLTPLSFTVFFDGDAAYFVYSLHLSMTEVDGGSISREVALVDGDTGRMTDLYVDAGTFARWLQRGG
ncbi:MAG: hypothetical protein ACLGIK_08495 [Gemmatimonadota bacterium]